MYNLLQSFGGWLRTRRSRLVAPAGFLQVLGKRRFADAPVFRRAFPLWFAVAWRGFGARGRLAGDGAKVIFLRGGQVIYLHEKFSILQQYSTQVRYSTSYTTHSTH